MILNKIRASIEKYGLISEGETVLAALSGGADSVCLTHALLSLSGEYNITLRCAHVNHGIRGEEALRDECFAVDFAKKLGIEIDVLRADVPKIAKDRGISEEMAGRRVRYDFFESLCKNHGIDKIATAHNKNDNAETLLMNFLRGSAVSGLGGIPPVREKIIRPILDITREEIEEYCDKNGLEYVTDSTNSSLVYTRNKIRGVLIPEIKNNFNPNFINTVTDNAVMMRADSAYIEKQAKKAYDEAVQHGGVSADKLSAMDEAIRSRVIRRMINDARGDLADVSSQHVSDICSLLTKESGTSANLSDGVCARIEYGQLIIEHPTEIASYRYTVKTGDAINIDEVGMTVTVSYTEERKNDGAIYLAADENSEITLRSRRAGDKFQPCGMTGSKKVKEYLINEKIPRGKRNGICVIEIDGQIAAVGKRADRGFLFKDKGVRIEFKPIREV